MNTAMVATSAVLNVCGPKDGNRATVQNASRAAPIAKTRRADSGLMLVQRRTRALSYSGGSGRADEAQQLLAAVLADFPGDRAEMPAHGHRGETELARDLERRQPAREELQHLRLALSQRDRDAAD